MKKVVLVICLVVLTSVLGNRPILACTNFLVSKGASQDGSTMVTYAADSHELYGELYFTPAGHHPVGAMREIYEWDTGKRLGEIPQPPQTYQVVGNMNEHQVVIGETTFGGRKELVNPKGMLDYGSLMFIALERARTARQAIEIMGSLVDRHGYYSSGESFSISDPKEVWLMEMVGKGPGGNGAVWVARRIPDGYFSAHANQSRIRRFPLNDRNNCLYAKDVISFARKKGYFTGKDKDFSFADTYAPLDYGALRFCEARVWRVFNRAAPSLNLSMDYINGVEGAQPLPLWIKPDKKLSVQDVMQLMRDHFEGTDFDLTKGVGAGPYELPYRWRPLVWEYKGKKYLNDRATSTQQTGFSFVSQSRSFLPNPIGGVLWFGVDDTASTVYVPMYCSIRQAPPHFRVGQGSFTEFSWESAFWVFNFVSNQAYHRYKDMIGDIQVVQGELEGGFLARQSEVDAAALALYNQAPELARAYLTEYSAKQAEVTVARYRALGIALFVKYLDGNVRDEKGKVTHPPYPEEWYQRIIEESGDLYEMKTLPGETKSKRGPKERCHTVPGTFNLPPVCF